MQGTSDGTTPSLLDARAASPSAVYATRFMATPFRGALAALPVDAALAAPLVDSSPFQLSDCGMDTVCLADEAQRVAANLAMAAGGFAATPGVVTCHAPVHREGLVYLTDLVEQHIISLSLVQTSACSWRRGQQE